MVRITVLGSSSSGNSTLLECGNTRLLIDIGFTAKKITDRLSKLGIHPDTLSAILITHEHTDHIQALPAFTRKWNIPVYITPLTHAGLSSAPDYVRWRFFESGCSFSIDDVIITSFPIPHDAADPVGFRFDYHGACYGHLSDAGNITDEIRSHLAGVHALFVEMNYDPALLESDYKRPWPVKQRIASYHGHLSNQQACDFVTELAHENLEHVILGHLSKDCNKPDIALQAMEQALLLAEEICNPNIHCTHPDEILDWILLKTELRDLSFY